MEKGLEPLISFALSALSIELIPLPLPTIAKKENLRAPT
jgi:hypothetical protein